MTFFFKHYFTLSAREKDDNMRTIEDLLEKGLIEVANKEEALKVFAFSSAASHTFD